MDQLHFRIKVPCSFRYMPDFKKRLVYLHYFRGSRLLTQMENISLVMPHTTSQLSSRVQVGIQPDAGVKRECSLQECLVCYSYQG